MSEEERALCIVLPYQLAYSETFIKIQIERLPATVTYLNRFPVYSSSEVAWRQLRFDDTKILKEKAKTIVHRYALNPLKKIHLRHFFITNHIKVVLAEYGITGVGVMRTCELLQLPFIVHFHGSDAYSRTALDLYGKMYSRMFAYAVAIIAVSKHMVGQLLELGAPAEKVFYNPYGVDLEKFKPGLRRSSLQVLAVGRFVEKKAPYLTILAFRKVLDRLPDAKLVMVGAGVLQETCRQITKSLHMEHAVVLKGALDHDQVARLMQESRLFVQHSVVAKSGDSEGTPVGILEAGAAALPVVSTAHAGIVDAVIHEKTGFLVNEGDIDDMSQRMYALLTNDALAIEMGRQARKHIAQNYNIEDSIKRLRDIVDKCAPKTAIIEGNRLIRSAMGQRSRI